MAHIDINFTSQRIPPYDQPLLVLQVLKFYPFNAGYDRWPTAIPAVALMMTYKQNKNKKLPSKPITNTLYTTTTTTNKRPTKLQPVWSQHPVARPWQDVHQYTTQTLPTPWCKKQCFCFLHHANTTHKWNVWNNKNKTEALKPLKLQLEIDNWLTSWSSAAHGFGVSVLIGWWW